MKRPRHILLASSLLTLLAAACSKDDLVPEATQPTDGADGLVEMTFTATAAPATRTTLGEKGADGEYPVLWTSGDEIVVMPAYGRFDKSGLEEMKFTTSIEGGARLRRRPLRAALSRARMDILHSIPPTNWSNTPVMNITIL